MKFKIILKGGPGSGHYGHSGRPGQQGGSAPGSSGIAGDIDNKYADIGDIRSRFLFDDWMNPLAARALELEQIGKNIDTEWRNSISGKEARAIHDYSQKGYLSINKGLRTGKLTSADSRRVNLIDSALDKAVTNKDIVVYRGQQRDEHFPTGDFHAKAFVSTSLSSQMATLVAGSDRGIVDFAPENVIRIIVPKGSHAAYIGDLGERSQFEMLLPRNSTFKFVSDNTWELQS